MNKRTLFLVAFILLAGLFSLVSFQQVSSSSQGGGFTMSWFTMDGGGGASQGGNYTLNGTVGQFDAGSMSGGNYTVQGGYWQEQGFLAEAIQLFLPVILTEQ